MAHDRAWAALLAGLTGMVLLLAACGTGQDEPSPSASEDAAGGGVAVEPEPASEADEPDRAPDHDAAGEEEVGDEPGPDGPQVDPAEVGADELGHVPVLMFHQLREDGGSEWDLSPEEFRAELEWLFDHGYVPIRTIDLVRGEIDVPAGMSPVVLTFDDATRSQAYLDEDGEVAADSSIGILVEVAEQYEHVEPIASMYVITSSLFGGAGDGEQIVAALHDLGLEIGNHSHTHRPLRTLSDDEVREDLATNVAVVRSIVDAEVATLSLPLGIFPQDEELAVSGEWDGQAYEHEGVLLVGYDPARSPFHREFQPAAIPRIQTHPDPEYQFGSAWWLEQLDSGSNVRRYVSDGDPSTISFPEDRADELAPAFEDRANPY